MVSDSLHIRSGGVEGSPRLLLLLHGMAGTGDVWRPFTDQLAGVWAGRWMAVDLAGHGRSPRRARYSFGGLASDVAATAQGDEVVVVGHSLGGAVGLVLATGWFGLNVSTCATVGMKLDWSDDELAKARQLSARPPKRFPTRAEAASFWLRLAGLQDVITPVDAMLDGAVVECEGHWQLTFDNAANAIGGCDAAGLLSASRARVVMSRGERDDMVSDDAIRALGLPSRVLAGAGHNAHVETPTQLIELMAAEGIL